MMSTPARCRRPTLAVAVGLFTQLILATGGHAQSAPAGRSERMHGMDLDRVIRTYVLADQLEIQPNVRERQVAFEFLSWTGGDYRRLFFRAQGEIPTEGRGDGALQADVLYGRLLSPFWSAVGGVRVDTRARTSVPVLPRGDVGRGDRSGGDRVTRGMLAVGLFGIAPYWFEFEPTLFVSDKGDVSAELETSFDMTFTQRLILQPRVELNAAVQAVPAFGIQSGLNDVEFGARLRYEIRRKFAPYVGVSWHRSTGATAARVKAAGEPISTGGISAGVRLWR